MDLLETTLEGTLGADGTIRLDSIPGMPPGRVTCVVKPAAGLEPVIEDLITSMSRLRREYEEAGGTFDSDEAIEARIAEMREGDWLDDWLAEQNKENPKEPPSC